MIIEGTLLTLGLHSGRLVVEDHPNGWRLVARFAGMIIPIASMPKDAVMGAPMKMPDRPAPPEQPKPAPVVKRPKLELVP